MTSKSVHLGCPCLCHIGIGAQGPRGTHSDLHWILQNFLREAPHPHRPRSGEQQGLPGGWGGLDSEGSRDERTVAILNPYTVPWCSLSVLLWKYGKMALQHSWSRHILNMRHQVDMWFRFQLPSVGEPKIAMQQFWHPKSDVESWVYFQTTKFKHGFNTSKRKRKQIDDH